MSRPTVSFAGSDLAASVPGLIIVATDPYKFPTRQLSVGKVANTDRSVMSAAFYQDKKINVTVEIGQTTRELLEAAYDTLTALLQGQEQALVCSYAGGTRQWTATLNDIVPDEIKGGHGTFDIIFECADPIGTDVNSTPIFSNNLSGASNTNNFILGGSAPWQMPVITITLTSVTGGTNKTMTLANTLNGQSVSITRTFANGDVIVIDPRTEKVTVNGSEVQVSGSIPKFAPNVAAGLSYSDNFTTRIRQTTAIYYKRWA